MAAVVPRIGEDELWEIADHLDIAATIDAARTGRQDATAAGGRPVLPAAAPTALPAVPLAALRSAGCVAGTVRRLLGSTVLTAAVVGAAPELWWHVWTLCRSVRSITAIAIAANPAPAVPAAPVPARVADRVALAGMELSRAGSVPAAVFGANLVVAVSPGAVATDRLGAGTVLVEAVPGAVSAPVRARAVATVDGDAPAGPVAPDGFTLVRPATRTARLDAVLAERLLAVRAGLWPRRV